MKYMYNFIKISLAALFLAIGFLYLNHDTAEAFRCDDRSYAGTLTDDGFGCINDDGQECFVCISEPIEN